MGCNWTNEPTEIDLLALILLFLPLSPANEINFLLLIFSISQRVRSIVREKKKEMISVNEFFAPYFNVKDYYTEQWGEVGNTY